MREWFRIVTELMIEFVMMIYRVLHAPVDALLLILDYLYTLIRYIIPAVVFGWYIFFIYLIITGDL